MSNRIDSNDESWTEALEACSVEETQSEDASSVGFAVRQILRELQSLPKDHHQWHVDEIWIHGNLMSWRGPALPESVGTYLSKLFRKEGEKHFSEKIIQDARLQVLGAIGLFLAHNKLLMLQQEIMFPLFHSKFYYGLDFLELKTLLGPVGSSLVLEELWLCHQVVFNTTESWILVAELIRSVRTLRSLIACDASILVSELAVVAGAVTATYPSPLTKLELRRNAIFNEAGAKLLVDVLRSAPNLIELGVGPFEDEVGAKQIGEAVASHLSLKKLFLEPGGVWINKKELSEAYEGNSHGRGVLSSINDSAVHEKTPTDHFLTAAFGGQLRTTGISIQRLVLASQSSEYRIRSGSVWTTSLGILPQMLGGDIPISRITLAANNWHVHSVEWQSFMRSLQGNSSIQELDLRVSMCGPGGRGLDKVAFGHLVEFLKSTKHLKKLTLLIDTGEGLKKADFNWPAFYMALSSNSTITSFKTYGSCLRPQEQSAEKEFFNWMRTTTSLTELEVPRDGMPPKWSVVFKALGENTSLRKLQSEPKYPFRICDGDPEAFGELMAMIKVNSTLRDISIGQLSEHEQALVRQALESAARQETYVAKLRKSLDQTEWSSPRCGRIFLCGSGMAGKTRLAFSMLNVEKKKSLMKRIRNKVKRRTEGVEIHCLRNDETMQLMIWDLAGQDIFQAMHEYLFPRLSRSCIFIFVFSPVRIDEDNQMRVKPRLEEAFEAEFRRWLRLIASNAAVTGFILPEVMVVVSHRDKAQGVQSTWHHKILAKLSAEFGDVIHIHTPPNSFFVNCCDTQLVQPIIDHVYATFSKAFNEKLFKVPRACSEMSTILVGWALKQNLWPIITYDEFYSLCEKVSDLSRAKLRESERPNVLRAVASYLHDTGTIVEFPEYDMMVVNPNWLTHEFLGSLVCIGHGFQRPHAPGKKCFKMSEFSTDGFLGRTDFGILLSQFFLKPLHNKGFKNIDQQTLENLMKSLGLCFELCEGQSDSRFFVPTLFKAECERKLEWHPNAFSQVGTSASTEISYYGLRVRCKDPERTYLSSGFFARFQVTIWPKLLDLEELSLRVGGDVQCTLDLISMMVDGLEIFVENDGEGGFIDVMVRSIKSRKAVWEFVSKYVVTELIGFCASPRGCPGVELVVDILRTECVEKLTLRKHRKDQSVTRDFLKQKVKESIGRQDANWKESDSFLHTWKRVEDASLEVAYEPAMVLLPPPDVEEFHEWVKIESKLLAERDVKLEQVVTEFDNTVWGGKGEGNSAETAHGRQGILRPADPGVERMLNEVRQDVKIILAEMRGLKSDVLHMIRLHEKVLCNWSQLSLKLDRLMGISDPSTHSRFPTRPYFTKGDVGWVHRLTSFVKIGKPLMLHFKCENTHGNHFVEHQPGFELMVEKENREVLRLISVNAVRVTWFLLKAAVHVTTSGGNLVPELELSDGSYTKFGLMSMSRIMDELHIEDESTAVSDPNATSAEKAWSYLRDYLRDKLEDNITNFFLLHPAQYLDKSSTHAWLCEECLEKGVENRTIRKL